MIRPVDTPATKTPLVVRSPNVRAGGLILFAVFAGTLAGGFSTLAIAIAYPVLGLVLLYGVRGVSVMARCTADGIKVRNQWRTVKLAWSEVAAIEPVPRGAERKDARAAGVIVRRDGSRVPLQVTYLPNDGTPHPAGPDRGLEKVESIRQRWAGANRSGGG